VQAGLPERLAGPWASQPPWGIAVDGPSYPKAIAENDFARTRACGRSLYRGLLMIGPRRSELNPPGALGRRAGAPVVMTRPAGYYHVY